MASHALYVLVVKDGRGGLAAIGTIKAIDLLKGLFMSFMKLPIQILRWVLLKFLEETIDQLALTFGFVEIRLEFWFQLNILSCNAKLR